jgi:hypothetical protein
VSLPYVHHEIREQVGRASSIAKSQNESDPNRKQSTNLWPLSYNLFPRPRAARGQSNVNARSIDTMPQLLHLLLQPREISGSKPTVRPENRFLKKLKIVG